LKSRIKSGSENKAKRAKQEKNNIYYKGRKKHGNF